MVLSIFKRSASKNSRADYLDRAIPLDGATHAEVVEYSVDVPMRYAQWFAKLADGRTVRLKDTSQFLGWSGWDSKRSFLFRNGRRRIELQSKAGRPISGVTSWLSVMIGRNNSPVRSNDARKFIARDGSQLVLA